MNDLVPPRRLGRSTWAIVAGFLVVAILSTLTDLLMHATGVFPPTDQTILMTTPLWILATTYRVIYTVGGNWLTARMAPRRPMKHAIILGAIGTVIATLGVVFTWNKGPEFGPKWYPISLVVTALPCSWIGAKLAMAQKN
jgi:MFS family permease